MKWNLTGTETQKAIARQAFERIKFPFERLSLPGTPELGWDNLNYRSETRSHEGHHGTEDKPHPLTIKRNGRDFTLGVIYIFSGRIYIDVSLVNEPMTAMTTIAAEVAHAVDIFMPMTDEQRNEFLRLWGKGGTWWEVNDYGSEYFTLGGEAFMREFTQAYAPTLDFDSISGFMHDSGVEPADVCRVLGIERTDYVAPAPVLPSEPSGPVGGTDGGAEPAQPTYVRYGTSKVYHRPGHRVSKNTGETLTSLDGLRPCKVCKP